MAESWLQRRARLKREKQKRDQAAKVQRDLNNIKKAEKERQRKQAADEVAKKRRQREQRNRNQGK